MQENQGRSTSSNVSMMCSDVCGLIIILVLYLVGNDKECGVPADHLLLSYIIIKASLIPIRILMLCLGILLKGAGVIINLILSLVLLCGMIAYYIVCMVYFFDGDNNCKDEATVHWVGLLLIVIEGFMIFSLFALICCCLAIMIPAMIASSKN
mmetsp:Transcript_20059/g.17753  ORF Transcript_20059/g.17753 Transcript_20059/m.17753 type:complete len:153 (-) Transcript_20059:114-572(-)